CKSSLGTFLSRKVRFQQGQRKKFRKRDILDFCESAGIHEKIRYSGIFIEPPARESPQDWEKRN
ncbi:hypothetical protein, partial [uncultured Rikenella sp.]|uniref:hypothetical protein n=1 Tax=uncultured Rikenella sp. TaxID=368003 RepID=UPI00260F4D0B